MKNLIADLGKFWFTEAPAQRLAALRIIIGLFAFWYLVPRYEMFLEIAADDAKQFEPIGIIKFLDAPLPVEFFQVLVILLLLANIAFLLGWRHRWTGAAFAFLLLFVLTYRNSWTMIYHSDNVLVWHVLILAFTPAADAYSLDARRKNLDQPAHWRYGWAIRLLCAVTLATYFLAGFAKLVGADGLNWLTGDVLRAQIAVDNLRKELLSDEAPATFALLYDQLFLFTLMGIGTFVMELGAPLALLNKKVAKLWSIGAFVGHWGIYFIMGIIFRYQMAGIIFAPFFEVERPIEWAITKAKRFFAAKNLPNNSFAPKAK